MDISPISIMQQYYAPHSEVVIAFKTKGSFSIHGRVSLWTLCKKPLWNWGECDYKIVDLDLDDFNY